MKIQAKISPLILIEVEGNTQKDVFDQLSMASEVFGEKSCGLCSEKNLTFAKRTINGDDYYELTCSDCNAKLSFGQSKKNKGQLFPIRKLIKDGPDKGKPSRKDGEYGQHRGWTKFRGRSTDIEE